MEFGVCGFSEVVTDAREWKLDNSNERGKMYTSDMSLTYWSCHL